MLIYNIYHNFKEANTSSQALFLEKHHQIRTFAQSNTIQHNPTGRCNAAGRPNWPQQSSFSDHLCIEASGGATAGEHCAIVYNWRRRARKLRQREKKLWRRAKAFPQHPFLPAPPALLIFHLYIACAKNGCRIFQHTISDRSKHEN